MKKTYLLGILFLLYSLSSFSQDCTTQATLSSDTSICFGDSTTITLTNSDLLISYQLRDGLTDVGAPVQGNGASINFIVNPAATTTYSVYAVTCDLTYDDTVTITVNPIPDAAATNATQTICSGIPITTMVMSGIVASTTYNWTRDNTIAITGIAASGSGNISGTLTNTTTAPVTVTFTITPTANGCDGTPITATILVNPTPNVVATNAAQTICSGTPITTMVMSGSVASTTYNWTRDNTIAITGIAASGSGNISGTLTNTTTAPVTVTFTITPTANGCDGTPITATVLVNPTPNVVATNAAQTICSGTPITTMVMSGSVASTTYNWTRNNTISVTGIAASGAGNISGTLTNTTTAPVTVTFTITPTANGCDGTPITATVLVNPTPNAMATNTAQTICSGTPITTMVMSGSVASTTYNWTRNNTISVTGIAASGTGNISGTLTNTTTAPVTVTFTITPTANGCNGTPITATVLVNPTPNAVTTNAAQTICSGTPITTMVMSGSVASTTYNWTRNNTISVTGIAASGAGNISGTLTNTTTAPVTVTFTITPTANGCNGTPIIATVLVNPRPTAAATNNAQNICSGNNINTMVLSGAVAGTTYNWTRDNTVAVTGIAASGGGNISGTLTNTTTASVTVTFTVTPTANGCSGTPITTTVLVRPTPNVVVTNSGQNVCEGTAMATMVMSGSVAGTTYNWTRNNTVNVTGIANNGSGNISGTPNNTTNTPQTVTYTITPTAGGCNGTPITATIVVNPRPNASVSNDTQTICSGNTIATMVINGSNVAGTTYNWTRNNTVNVTGIAASGTGNISGSLSNITNNSQTVTFTITPIANGCSGTSTTATVVVRPVPDATATNSAQTICSGTAMATMTFSGNVGGTTYNWTRDNTVSVTGIGNNGSGNINGTFTNTTAAPVTVTFTITPRANFCNGNPITTTVVVNPAPIITSQPATPAATCTGTGVRTFSVTATGATTYQWRRGAINLTNNAIYSGVNTPTLTITNPTLAEGGAYTVVIGNALGCTITSNSRTLTVTPVPSPSIEFTEGSNDTSYTINSPCGTISGGGQNDIDIVSGTDPGGSATYQWQVSLDNGVTWANAPGPTSNNPQYVLDPNYTTYESVSGVYKFRIIISENGCSGTSNVVTLNVNAGSNLTPGVIAGNQSSCGSATYNPATFTVTTAPTGGIGNFTYQWQSSTDNVTFTNIGGATGTTYNPPTISQTTYYRRIVTSGGCFAISNTLEVNFFPPPTITSPSTGTICNGVAQNYTITSSLPSTYSWTRAVVPGISNIAGAGATSPITETLINTTTAPIVVRYRITPRSIIGLCTGAIFNYDVTVTPSPTANIGASQAVCNNGTATFSVALTGTSPWNITYSDGTTSTTVNNISTNPYIFSVTNITTNKTFTITALSDSNCNALPANLSGAAIVTVLNGAPGIWTGLISTDWFDCLNWAGGLPSSTDNVIIPSSSPQMPVIDTSVSPFAASYGNVANAQDLNIAVGASLTMKTNSKIQISGNWKNSGTFDPGLGTVVFNGSTTNQIQTINMGIKNQERFYNLTLNNTNGARGVSVADGFELTVSNDLSLLSGDLRLIGEAQMIQNGTAPNPVGGTGKLLRDQQGTKSSYHYNYWSSPVSQDNLTYTVGGVLRDGTNAVTAPFNPELISFGGGYDYSDGPLTSPIKISNRWIYKYTAVSTNHSSWQLIGNTGSIKVGEGFTMKGVTGLEPNTNYQNYIFVGKPNNGDINLNISLNQIYLIGNPYSSALDADEFIKDNIFNNGRASSNIFNGTLYFWDHFGGQSHMLNQYVGGYAAYTLLGGVLAVSNDPLINNNNASGTKIPKRYVAVGQGFFVRTDIPGVSGITDPITGGTLTFKNSQRAFKTESSLNSIFFKSENNTVSADIDNRQKIRLGFEAASGLHRQLLVGADPNTTNRFDIGYDAPMLDQNPDDMYWSFSSGKFVIQGVPDFNNMQIIPLGIKISTAGITKIKIDELENIPTSTEIYLFDSSTGIYYDIKNHDFTTDLPVGEYNNRFSLRFTSESLNSNEVTLNNGIMVFTDTNHILNIKNNISDVRIESVILYNILEQSIAKWNVMNEQQQNIKLPVEHVRSGTYIVKLKTSDGSFSKKIIIN